MTEKSDFVSGIEKSVNEEVDRILKELDRLKFDANQAVLVLNSLNLPVPDRLRQLVTIETVPRVSLPPLKKIPGGTVNVDTGELKIKHGGLTRATRSKGGKKGSAVLQARAEEKFQRFRTFLLEVLAKGPVMRNEVYRQGRDHYFSDYTIQQGFKRMRKVGEVDQRTVGLRGPSEWFLPSRPVTLEQVRDASLKVRTETGVIPPGLVSNELKVGLLIIEPMMHQLVSQGILREDHGLFTYEKPESGKARVNRTKVKEVVPRVRMNGRGKTVAGTGRGDRMSSDKEVRQILQKAESMGAQTKKQGNDHIAVTYKGETKIIAATPGDKNRSNREKLKDLGINV